MRISSMEVFPDYAYDEKTQGHDMPMYIDGKWKYDRGAGRTLDRTKVEDFKTRFYKFEGYNPDNGYPTRETLEKMNLKNVADVLQSKGKLG
jgi:aldehyde:ferredoxin oxidoreductase